MTDIMVSREFAVMVRGHIDAIVLGDKDRSSFDNTSELMMVGFNTSAVSEYLHYFPEAKSVDSEDLFWLNEHVLESYVSRKLLTDKYDGDFQEFIRTMHDDSREGIHLIEPASITLNTSNFQGVLRKLQEYEVYESLLGENSLRVFKGKNDEGVLTDADELLQYLRGFDHIGDRLVGGYKVAEGVKDDWHALVFYLIEAGLIDLEQLRMRENTAMDDELAEKIEQG
jgi:hypothetical protein